MTSYDFYNPVVSVAILDLDGNRWPLWTDIEQQVNVAAYNKANLGGLTALCFVSEVTVSVDLSGVPTIKVVLTPPLEEGRLLLDSSILEWPYSTLEVQLGYLGSDTVIYTGMMQQPEFQLGADISITLTGIGEGGFDAATSPRNDTLPRQSRLAAIESLIKGSNGTRDASVVFPEVLPGSEAFRLLQEEVLVSPGGYTEWYLIKSLARQCRCWTLFLGKVLKLRPYQELLVAPPVRNFYFRDYPNGLLGPAYNAFPILAVSSETTGALFYTGMTRGILQKDIQSASGEIVTNAITDKNVKTSRTGLGSPRIIKRDFGQTAAPTASGLNADGFVDGEGVHGAVGSPEDAWSASEAVAQHDDMSSKGIGVELTIETLGCPDLFPGDAIAVFGVGKRFDSTRNESGGTNYAIYEMTHRIGDGFSTTLKCNSNVAPFASHIAVIQADADGVIAKAPLMPTINFQSPTVDGSQRRILIPIEGDGSPL